MSTPTYSLKTEEVLHLSAAAVRRILALKEQSADKKPLMLRIAVEGGGCFGFQYNFKLDSNVQADDRVFTQEGASVIVDEISLEFIKGAELDYSDQLIGSSFTIRNPNASSGCGCGNSFSI